MWLKLAKSAIALRKHNLRVDLRIYSGDPAVLADPNAAQGAVRGILQSAIMNGLDVVGIVSPQGPELGLFAQSVVQNEGLDIFAIPGQEYVTQDGFKVIAYNMPAPIPPGMGIDQTLGHIRQSRGFSMVVDVSKRQVQHINKLSNTDSAPDSVEVYNSTNGAFHDIDVDAYPKFVNSGATKASDLQKTKTYTSIPRADLERMGLLPKGQGMNYEPRYLHPGVQAPIATIPQEETI